MSDTILDLKRRIAESESRTIESVRFFIRGDQMGQTELVEDSRFVQDFTLPRSGRLYLERLGLSQAVIAAEIGDEGNGVVLDSRNTVEEVELSMNGASVVGDYVSEAAVAALTKGIKVSGGTNGVGKAKVGDNAMLVVGNRFGGTDPLSMLLQRKPE